MWQEDFTQYVKGRQYSIPSQDTAVSSTIYNSPDGELAQSDMFALLKAGDEKGWLVAAGTPGKDELTEGDGPQASAGRHVSRGRPVWAVRVCCGRPSACTLWLGVWLKHAAPRSGSHDDVPPAPQPARHLVADPTSR